MPLEEGTKLGPYEILSPLGAGGMGEVYRAKDTRLKREVAIKVLPEATTKNADALARFQREAEAVAALSHPNIMAIYDVGREDDTSYLVSELLQGETLRGRLERLSFPWRKAVEIGVAVADGVAAAHAKGIIHRDLKPENIFLTDDALVKILDFGLASIRQPAGDADRTVTLDTKPGTVLGTACYMSPEQVRGQLVDARSDVFSFGCVLYEVLTGKRAFGGLTSADVSAAILAKEPVSVTELATGVPPDLVRTVKRCLEKNPRQRFHSFEDLAFSLRNVLADSAAGRVGGPVDPSSSVDDAPSIAVLPFENISADPENEYFGDGLAEEIMNALAQVEGLKVIARTSAFSFKGNSQDVRQIARALGVSHVLEGSVRRSGDRVRVTAQLIAAVDGAHVWSDRFDRPMTDVFAMQDEMAGAITTALTGRLGVTPTRAQKYVPNIDAYDSYLAGRTHLNQFTPQAWSRAKADFDRAIRADPSYAKPHAELALGYFIRGMHGMQPMREVAPFVRAGSVRALDLDPTDPQPRFVLGAIELAHDYRWDEAADHFAASMGGTHVPGHARWIYASLYLRGLGRFVGASAEMERAAEQDPLNATWHAIWAAHLTDAGRVEEAMAIARRSIEIDSTYFLPHLLWGEASWAAGQRDEAVAAFERAYALAPWFAVTSGWLAATHRLAGSDARADALLDPIGATARPLWGRVLYHLLLSELDAAADWYQRMIEQRDPFALVYARAPTTAPLRAHHRWQQLSELMKLPG